MKTIILLAIIAALFLTSCTYRVQFGKACTPGHSEWSYVWIKEKGEFLRQLQLIWFDNHVHQEASLNLLNEIVGKERQVLGTNFLGWDQPDRNLIKEIPSYLADNAKKLLRL